MSPAQSSVKLAGATFSVTELLLASGKLVDLNGEPDALVLDALQNIRLDGSTAGHLKIKIAGAYDFDITANLLTALAGSVIATDTIAETTADAGVTIDGVLIKDGVVAGHNTVVAVAASGAVAIPLYSATHFITKSSAAAAMTIVDPTATTHDGVRLTFISTTARAHTLDNSAGSGFFSSGGASKDVATFGGAIGDGLSIIAYQGKWYLEPGASLNITLG